jgi:hypothetical protein
VFLAKFCDSRSCREFEAVIFGAYPLLGVFIIFPKFRLKASSGLGDPSIESLELTRGRFFWAVQEVPTLRLYVPVGGRKFRKYLPLSLGLGLEVPTSWSYVPVGCCSSRFCRKFRQYLPVGLGLGPEVPTSWSYIPVGCCSA